MLSQAGYGDVRIKKLSEYFREKGVYLEFIGWNRTKGEIPPNPTFDKIITLQSGGGFGTKFLPVLYIIYIFRLFVFLLFKKNLKSYIIYATNFETAVSVWAASKIRAITYVYDIFDECAISNNFPGFITAFIRKTDAKVRKSSEFYIHVDDNRLSDIDSDNHIIVYNSPVDVKRSNDVPDYENSFAVTGWLNNTRGLQSIYKFAKNNASIKFIVAGEFNQKEYEELFLSLPNVDYHHFMPQQELFKLICNCRGIFSLYDNSIPINRLAASNKLYDAMMLSIPVIVNKELVAAEFVRRHSIGYIVSYNYDKSWDSLSNFNKANAESLGANGRKLYLSRYEFNVMLDKELWPKLQNIEKNKTAQN